MKFLAISSLLLALAPGSFASGSNHHLRTKNEGDHDHLMIVDTTTVGDAHQHQRQGKKLVEQDDESICNHQPDMDACYKVSDEDGTPCQWCVAGAIPSECMSEKQAKVLPEGVFECSAPGKEDDATTSRSLHFDFPSSHFLSGTTQRFTLQTSAPEPTKSDLCDASSASLSGYMDIKGSEYDENGENKHLFFWMFEKRGDYDDDTPFVVWLTGGPGCSSTLALLSENGPCSVNHDAETTTVNPASWTEAAHVLWLDQPAGVGFSYGQETDTNEKMIAEDAYYFLQAFFQTYPQYQSSPLYIVGESYGGHCACTEIAYQ